MIQLPLLSALAALPLLAGSPKSDPPPGMVLIEGGNTTIGISTKEAERQIREDESLIRILARETPEHTVRVDDFFVGVTEVTNEQYAAFVRAAGARPPEAWAEQVITEAGRQFLEEQGKAIQAAIQAGQTPPERKKFDRSQWWRDHWEGKEWALPRGTENLPVVYIDFQDARAYARWAGVRLMSEFEYQRAVRGSTDRLYPWGEEFDEARAITETRHLNGPSPVGDCPDGANEQGVRHLAGNVWEWTSSPFVPYPKFKPLTITVGKGDLKRTLDGLVQWNANQRVAVGGSFQNGAMAARATTRRASERVQSTDSLGFRVAASTSPGLDIADYVLKDDVPASERPDDVEYDTGKAQAMDLWQSEPGVASTPAAGIKNYGVITGYDYVLFIPTAEVPTVSVKGLRELSEQNGPVQLGVLTSTRPMLDPELAPGTYLVTYRAKGEPPEEEVPGTGMLQDDGEEEARRPVVKMPEGYDWSTDNLIYYRPDGEPVTWTLAPEIEYTRPKQPEILIADGTRKIPGVDADGKPIEIEDPVTRAIFTTNTWVKVSNKALHYTLTLVFAPGTVSAAWRH